MRHRSRRRRRHFTSTSIVPSNMPEAPQPALWVSRAGFPPFLHSSGATPYSWLRIAGPPLRVGSGLRALVTEKTSKGNPWTLYTLAVDEIMNVVCIGSRDCSCSCEPQLMVLSPGAPDTCPQPSHTFPKAARPRLPAAPVSDRSAIWFLATNTSYYMLTVIDCLTTLRLRIRAMGQRAMEQTDCESS
jgi:hypothetical protein